MNLSLEFDLSLPTYVVCGNAMFSVMSVHLFTGVVGQMIKTECLSFGSRRGLLACVYNGVSLTMNECLSGGKWLLYSTAQCP